MARPYAIFVFPAGAYGKGHVAARVTGLPICGAGVPLSSDAIEHLAPYDDPARLHPLCCRRCVATIERQAKEPVRGT